MIVGSYHTSTEQLVNATAATCRLKRWLKNSCNMDKEVRQKTIGETDHYSSVDYSDNYNGHFHVQETNHGQAQFATLTPLGSTIINQSSSSLPPIQTISSSRVTGRFWKKQDSFFNSASVLNCTTEVTSGAYQRQAGMGQTLPPLTTTMLPVIPVNSSVPSNTVVTGQQVHISVGNWNYATGQCLSWLGKKREKLYI